MLRKNNTNQYDRTMKKLLIALCFVCALAVAVNAQDKEAKKEAKGLRKEMLDKYDANKDGKLDKEEKAKMSAEDKAKWDAAFPHKKKDAPKTEEPKKEETK